MVKVSIICAFFTNENYTISEDFLKEYNIYRINTESIECESISREICKKYYDAICDSIGEEPYGEMLYPDYMFKLETINIIEARNFIEKLSVSFRVNFICRYFQKDLYNMTDHALEYINSFNRLLKTDFFEVIPDSCNGSYINIFSSFVSN